MATTYTVDPRDDRLESISHESATEVTKSNATYDKAISGVDTHVTNRTNAVKEWEQKQTDIQNEQTDFAIDKIEQQKGQAQSDYIKEQSGAYKDWQKQSNAYGANAEQMAAQGMANSGYSESSQVSMYNTYQNRVATAREAYSRAVLNYDNAITEARLANSSALATIAYESLQKQLEIAFTGFQYKNTLITEKAAAAREIKQNYMSLYNAMYGNILSEHSLNETARHNAAAEANAAAQLKLEQDKFKWTKDQAKQERYSIGSGSGGSSGGSSSGNKIQKNSKKTTNNRVTKPSKTSTPKNTKNAIVDSKSVLKLGYGPISAKKLNQLVSEGKAVEYEKNGKIKFRSAFQYK